MFFTSSRPFLPFAACLPPPSPHFLYLSCPRLQQVFWCTLMEMEGMSAGQGGSPAAFARAAKSSALDDALYLPEYGSSGPPGDCATSRRKNSSQFWLEYRLRLIPVGLCQ